MKSIVDNIVVSAVLDTGATISVINQKIQIKLGVPIREENSSIHSFHSHVNCSGYISVPITVGLITRNVNLFVISELNHDLILGLDNISKFKLSIKSNYEVFQEIDFEGKSIETKIYTTHLSAYPKVNSLTQNFEKDKIDELLSNYSSIFSTHKYDIGCIDLETCRIDLKSDIPISLRPYRCSEKDQKTLEEQINLLLKFNLIRKSNSPYSFPVTLVNKKDEGEKSRLCIDFRQLNKIAIADNFPFPRIEDIIDKLAGSKYFSALDISSSFWHIKMRNEDIQKTAFVTQNDHFEWTVMPFGYRNSPAIFQRALYRILEKYDLKKFSHNYIDDILIHSSSFEEHLKHLKLAFEAFLHENIKFKLSKCEFAVKIVNYLGHSISENKIFPLNSNIEAIARFPVPIDKKSLQRFLGKVNYYRKFIQNVTEILAPLFSLLKNSNPFKWNEKCQKAFETVKEILTHSPVLQIYNHQKHCFVSTDASRIGIDGVLKQESNDSSLHPVAYFSKKLLPYQLNYTISELECLAIVEALDYWHHYLYGKKFTVITDHQALQWLGKIKKPNSRLFKWSLKLSQYDFNIQYNPGTQNVEADALSRSPVLENFNRQRHPQIINSLESGKNSRETILEENGMPLPKIDRSPSDRTDKNGMPLPKIDRSSSDRTEKYDMHLSKIDRSTFDRTDNGMPLPEVDRPTSDRTKDHGMHLPKFDRTKNYDMHLSPFDHENHLKIVNLLEKSEIKLEQTLENDKNQITTPKKNSDDMIVRKKGLFEQIYVPFNLRQKLVEEFHRNFGHIGIKKTLQMLSKSYTWPNMTKDVKNFIDSCNTCQLNKIKRCPKLGTLSILKFAKNPFEIISIDSVGGLEGYNSKQKYLHLAIDQFSRFVWATTSRTQKAKDFCNLIQNMMRIGKPELILSDNYPSLRSNSFKKFLSESNISIIFVAPHTAKSNGMIERVNQTILDRLRCKFFEFPTKAWTTLVHSCIDEYNNSIHDSTGFSPRYLLTGISNFESSLQSCPNLTEARMTAYENSIKSHEKNKSLYDSKHNSCNFNKNDLVLIDSHSIGKLEPRRIGPFNIIEKISDNSYRLDIPYHVRKNNLVNSEQMYPYKQSDKSID